MKTLVREGNEFVEILVRENNALRRQWFVAKLVPEDTGSCALLRKLIRGDTGS